MTNQKAVGDNFVQLRNAYGLSQIEFAKRCGLSDSEIVNIEQGKKPISPDDLLQIADGLKCNPCDLLLFISQDKK